MLNKKIQNKTELRDEINFILKKHSLLNAHLESQLIISHSAKKSNYLNVKFDDWMFLQEDGYLINIAKVKKFGITLGKVILFFEKE